MDRSTAAGAAGSTTRGNPPAPRPPDGSMPPPQGNHAVRLPPVWIDAATVGKSRPSPTVSDGHNPGPIAVLLQVRGAGNEAVRRRPVTGRALGEVAVVAGYWIGIAAELFEVAHAVAVGIAVGTEVGAASREIEVD